MEASHEDTFEKVCVAHLEQNGCPKEGKNFDEEDNNGLWLATYEIVSNKNTTTNILQRIQLDATDLASMPPSGPLNDCEIDIFKAWVEQGAQNN